MRTSRCAMTTGRLHLSTLFAPLCCVLLVLYASDLRAQIQFEEVTVAAGITGKGTTFGASWGDFNGDGWPDIWVGNHDFHPNLYLNRAGKGFTDITRQVFAEDPRSDYHGAAWADFDRDGDMDLISVADALHEGGALILKRGDDHLLKNEAGRFVNVSPELGINVNHYSRTPLWLDVENDGDLDLLIVSQRGDDQPSVLYEQTAEGRFEPIDAGLKERRTRTRELYLEMVTHLFDFGFNLPTDASGTPHQEAAQLLDLNGDGRLDLLFMSQPIRVYDTSELPFNEITYDFGLPPLSDVADVAAGDFNGDGHNDLFVTLGRYTYSDLKLVAPDRLHALIFGHSSSKGPEQARGIDFVTDGDVTIEIHPDWVAVERIRIGAAGSVPDGRTFRLSPSDASTWGPVPNERLAEGSVHGEGNITVAFDPATKTWQLRNSVIWQNVDVIVRSNQPITSAQPYNFELFKPHHRNLVLQHQAGALVERAIPADEPSTCMSVAAADFDNDMDLDVYAVCTGVIDNSANRLYENDGRGSFTLIPLAGGAEGSVLGRGDAVATADFDQDGFVDLFVTNGVDPTSPFVADGPHQLFRNLSGSNGNGWLHIDLAGRRSNPHGIGAKVEIRTGEVRQFREMSGGMHRFSQNHMRLHFGVGKHASIDELTVYWPSGLVQRLQGVAINQVLKLTEPDS